MSKAPIDDAGNVRAGEEVDLERVGAFLKAAGLKLDGTPTLKQFPGGASNLTYLIHYDNRDLILRRPPFGHIAKSAHDMVREARIMQALRPVYPTVPEILAICEDTEVIGVPFYVMERLVGVIPRQNLPRELALDADQTRQLCRNVIDRLVELHKLDPKATGLDSFGKGEGYVARQIEGWSKRYRAAITDDVGGFESVMQWLADKQPKRPNNNAKALESWEGEGGAPASDDRSIKRTRCGKARAAKKTLEERKASALKATRSVA